MLGRVRKGRKIQEKGVVSLKSAIQKIPEKVKDLLDGHDSDLEEAWANVGDEGLTLSISAKIGFDKQRKGLCDVTLSFVKEKVKDTSSFSWDDRQLTIPKIGAVK
jgi:hypothetical protein